MFLRSRRRTRVASLPIHDPFAAAAAVRTCQLVAPALLFLAGNGLGRPLAGASVGMGPLTAHWKPAAMSQPPVAAEVHQPLDIHCDVAPQIAFDHVVTIDDLANLQYLLVGQLRDPPLLGN